jgi:TolB-like protein/Tfp pilus assembly protein PilF
VGGQVRAGWNTRALIPEICVNWRASACNTWLRCSVTINRDSGDATSRNRSLSCNIGRTVLTPGARIGVFEILSPLGAGGMGEVYRARDPRLEREVALKVLPAETLGDDKARARLLREARMASKLNHPNICTIYEVGEADGQVYIAMELVSGEALSERLSSERMGTEEVLRLGRQMAGALVHAHDNGVVHRDFKSGNVVITPEGRAKVLDFGLAARVSDTELTEATTYSVDSLELSGKIVGTLAYMAPEQLKGEPADARSDIWALGIVLYEMASGVRPFQGKTGFELSSAILSATPEPLQAGPGGVLPTQLQSVIDRCFEKEPAQRYQSAGEVRAALETAQTAGTGQVQPVSLPARPGRRWLLVAAGLAVALAAAVALDVGGIRRLLVGGYGGEVPAVRMAVLPFANLSGDPEQGYLSDGFTQEMITQLGRLHPDGLSVIARTSVMRYKNGDTPVDQIGSELDVDYVLEGSTQREADRIRVAAELIDVAEQTQLWADSYEREFSGILAVQSEVAREVANALALELLPAEQARFFSPRAVDPEVYEAYLKGSYHWQKLTPEDLDAAQRYFELALEKDPGYAPAYEGLSLVWGARQQRGFTLPRVAGPKAAAAALRAIALDEGSAGAHFALAGVKTFTDWDWNGAEPEWRRALELDPNNAITHGYYAQFLVIVGRTEEALKHSERALGIDPINALVHGLHSKVLYFDRRFEEALAAAQIALEMQPRQQPADGVRQSALLSLGRRNEQLERQWERIARDPERVAAFEQGMAQAGYQGAQRAIADLLAARFERAQGVPDSEVMRTYMPFNIALRYVDAEDPERSMDWLEEAFVVRDPMLPYLRQPLYYDLLHSNPRYQDLLRRMNLPTAAF